jgi:hypothetical protein
MSLRLSLLSHTNVPEEDAMAADRMSRSWACSALLLTWLACSVALLAQQPTAVAPVPRVMWVSGVFHQADGQPIAPTETVTLAVYRDQNGGDPLWQETQNAVVRQDGRYDVLLGSTTTGGLPLDLFATGEPRWLGARFDRNGEAEQPRVQLASVPYSLKSGDAATLGGRPASDYALATAVGSSDARAVSAETSTVSAAADVVLTGTTNTLAKYVDATNVGNSAVFESNGLVGVNTTAPLDALHVRFTNTTGGLTGFAVQNLGNTASSYSGMLFYDQNGALGQFQGFNNISHEYRINNIAVGGSINFMLGSSSKFLVAPSGNIGIGAVPGATEKLRVAGNVVVDGNIGAKYQDVAEWVETAVPLDAGTVVIVDPTRPNRVVPSPRAYDTRVAGAVSAQPGLILGEKSEGKVTVAQSGRVRVKADASYGAIKIGDLLVTSPTTGYAMRSRPMRVDGKAVHRPGTLLGKALEALPSGKGDILVLLTLQ